MLIQGIIKELYRHTSSHLEPGSHIQVTKVARAGGLPCLTASPRPEPINAALPAPFLSSSTDAAVKLVARAQLRSSFSWKVSVAWRVFLPTGDKRGTKRAVRRAVGGPWKFACRPGKSCGSGLFDLPEVRGRSRGRVWVSVFQLA